MIAFLLGLPIWQAIRTLGIVAYLLLTIGICLGISYTMPVWQGKQKATVYRLHSSATISGMALGALHGILTVIDPYMPYTWREVLIPFAASYKPLLSGLGTLTAYSLILVVFTTDLRNKMPKKLWLAIHLLSYPTFLMAFLHGLNIGTDRNLAPVRWMFFLSVVAVVGMFLLRMATVTSTPAESRRPGYRERQR